MNARRHDPIDDDDLQDYIYGTIRRLERLAERLGTYSEETEEQEDEHPTPEPTRIHGGGTSPEQGGTG